MAIETQHQQPPGAADALSHPTGLGPLAARFSTSLLSARYRFHSALTVVALLVATVVFLQSRGQAQDKSSGKPASTVPVTVALVEQRDVPHWISGIGTVQSLHTVVIRPQITGVITEVLFKEGDLVEQGTLLARIDDRSIQAALAQAEAENASREAQLKVAQLDLARYGNLSDQRVVSRQTIDQQAALVEQLKAAIRASEATIAAERVQLSFTKMTSPVHGRAGIRRIDQGNLVQAGDTNGLVTVTQLDPISIVFTIPQEQSGPLRTATAAAAAAGAKPARVTAFDRDAGTLLAQGKLTTFDNEIDSATGTLRLRAEFENIDGKLWPGQFVTLQLETGISAKAIVVPARAVQQGLNGPFVFRVRDSKAEVAPITISYEDDEIAVIERGVAPAESVVLDGQSRLKAGAAVSVMHSAAGST
ncbi:MAG: efflux RND transporter periplasmic adaptor subunit [Gammaproteobacteria bacterium]